MSICHRFRARRPVKRQTWCMSVGGWRRRRHDPPTSTAVVGSSDPTVVVTALPLKAAARRDLAQRLGNVEIHDIRDDVLAAHLVLAPSCSPQAIAALKRAYPTARLVVVELDDDQWDLHLPSPVKRLLAAGADAYLTADSIAELASQLSSGDRQPAAAGQPQSALGTSSVDDVILAGVSDVIRRRAEATFVDPSP